ncbi:MAG: SUMF1/EgtB/PvdO family nonheme iron enzyme [Candidatus Glassbacteria bacterium]
MSRSSFLLIGMLSLSLGGSSLAKNSLQGYVYYEGRGLSNVLINVSSSAISLGQLSGENGYYIITGLDNGTYTVTPMLTGYFFEPESVVVTINGSNQTVAPFNAHAFTTATYHGILWSSIPDGSFQIGSNANDDVLLQYAKPVYQVTISNIWISTYEITQDLYRQVIGNNPSVNKSDSSFPVTNVTWYDAVKFCNKLSEMAGYESCYDLETWHCDYSKNGFRLPTEYEWEYACRAGSLTRYSSGDTPSDLNRVGWYMDNSSNTIHPVGKKSPNLQNMYDMHGNAMEWCNNWWSAAYDTTRKVDPPGPETGSQRSVRGGDYTSAALKCGSAIRNFAPPNFSLDVLGFRIASRNPGAPATIHSIRGRIVAGELGIDGVAVHIAGEDKDTIVTTDRDGYYICARLKDGTYSITPSKETYVFLPAVLDVELSYADAFPENIVGMIAPLIFLNRSSLDFGSISLGNTAERTLTISNNGFATLYVSSITASTPDFNANPTSCSIAPGGSQQILLSYIPAEAGPIQANLIIASNHYSNEASLNYVTLTGFCTAARPVLSNPFPDLGEVVLERKSGSFLILRNDGDEQLIVGSVASSNSAFTISPAFASIPAGELQTFDVTFAPTSIGEFSTTVSIRCATGRQDTLSADLTGEGIESKYSLVVASTKGDVDGNSSINIFDLLALLKIISSRAPTNANSDLNSNGRTDIFDLLELLKVLGSGKPTAVEPEFIIKGTTNNLPEEVVDAISHVVSPLEDNPPDPQGSFSCNVQPDMESAFAIAVNSNGNPTLLSFFINDEGSLTALGSDLNGGPTLCAQQSLDLSYRSTALGIVMLNPLLFGTDVEQKRVFAQKALQRPGFSTLENMIAGIFQANPGSDFLVDDSHPEVFEKAAEIASEVFDEIQSQALLELAAGRGPPYLGAENCRMVLYNPYHCYLSAGLHNYGSDSEKNSVFIEKKPRRWGLPWIGEDGKTILPAAPNESLTVNIYRGFNVSNPQWLNPFRAPGLATWSNTGQVIIDIIDIAASMNMQSKLAVLVKLSKNFRLGYDLGEAFQSGDLAKIIKTAGKIFWDNRELIMYEFWSYSSDPDKIAEYTHLIHQVLGNIAFPLKILNIANKVPFYYDLIVVPGKTTDEVVLKNCQLKDIVALVNAVVIYSEPEGASIYLDGTNMNRLTPAVLTDVAPGNHHVRLYKNGYNEYNEYFVLEAGSTYTINANLGDPLPPIPVITIYTPQNNAHFSDNVITVSGLIELEDASGNKTAFPGASAILTFNGIDNEILVSGGRFNEQISIASGRNTIQLRANSPNGDTGHSDIIVVYGDYVSPDIEITLTWNTPTSDIDLHVWNPNGEHSYYGHLRISEGFLDIDDVEGYGPETFTAQAGLSGTYIIKINSYSLDNDSYADVTVQVRIRGGEVQTYGPYRFTTDDYNDSDPSAWWEVVRINYSEGSILAAPRQIPEWLERKIAEDMRSLPGKQ